MNDRTVDETTQDNAQKDPSIVDVMEKQAKTLVRITAVLTDLAERLDMLEQLFDGDAIANDDDYDDDDEEPNTSRDADVIPPLALLADGRVLLHESEIEGLDLSTREVWRGVVLTESEANDVLDYVSDGISEAAGKTGAWMIRSAKRVVKKIERDEEEGGGGDDQG